MKNQNNRYRHLPMPLTLALALALVVTLVTMTTAYVVQAQEQSNQVYLPILFGDPAPSGSSLPDLVLAKQPSLHPEGVEWDAVNGRFLVGSLTQGTVFAVADDGTVAPFATSDNLSMGSVGIHIDKSTNRLLVTHSNPTALASEEVAGVAQLGIYDLTSGEELHFVDLTALGAPGGRFFANDVTSDADGNAYVTNSLSTVIYKVDVDGNAEIFVNNLGSNGIDYHSDGYLLAAAPQDLGLVKIPLDDPTALAPVTLSEPARMDGIILDANGELVAVAKTNFGADGSFEDEVLTFSSNDSWATATVSARGVAIPESAPTTVTLRDNNAYVVHAHFAELAAGAVVQEFEIQRVLFNEPSESPQDTFSNEEQTDTTPDSDLPTDSAELISAFFGLDNGLPLAANRGICDGAGGADGMPVVFSTEIDFDTMQAGDFQVTTASGEIGSIECVTLAPAIDEGELRTVLLVGEFGSAEDDPPTSVEIIGNLHSIDQTINFKGATVSVTPLEPGPSIVFAEIVPREMWNLGRESDGSWGSSNGCPAEGVVQIVRATWDGGVTLKDDEEITNANRDLYKVTVQSADGQTREISPFALGDLDDGDNNHELCLDTADKPISIFFPGGHFTDPNDDLNPETTISIP